MPDAAWDLDYSGTSPKQADMNAGKIPDGWYRCVLKDVHDEQTDGSKVLTMKVCHGPMSGCEHRERLWNPQFSDKPDKAKALVNAYAARLGLVGEDAAGRQVKTAFSGAIGKEVCVRLVTRKGEKGEFQNIGDFGFDLYMAGHAKMPAEAYVACGLPVPPHAPKGSDGGGKGGKAKDDAIPATKDTAAINAAAAKVFDY